jgi:hypothetical protein
MLILEPVVKDKWPTRIKGPLVRTLEPLVDTHSPIPNLH